MVRLSRRGARTLLVGLTLITAPAAAGEIVGKVARVADGDTFTIGRTRIRLCGIQAPERRDPGGPAATAMMRRLIAGRTIRCIPVGEGTPCDGSSPHASHDRVVAQCFAGSRDLAEAMVRAGRADDWPRFSGGAYASDR